jgi:hypothetical protein
VASASVIFVNKACTLLIWDVIVLSLLLLAGRGGEGEEKDNSVTTDSRGVRGCVVVLGLCRGPGWAPREAILLLPRWKWADDTSVVNPLNKWRLCRPLPALDVFSLLLVGRGGEGEWGCNFDSASDGRWKWENCPGVYPP